MHPNLVCSGEFFGKPVCKLGLASHIGAELTPEDVLFAVSQGVNFLNWAGEADTDGAPDAFSEAISRLGQRREEVVVCVQFGARTAAEAEAELDSLLGKLKTSYLDVITFYYVERPDEWERLTAVDGALTWSREAKKAGRVRRLGITSHQRSLAARIARSGLIDVLMIRYNAAHRGAEREVFPVSKGHVVPVIAYTATRWGALVRPTPDDPPGFTVPPAPEWYRFVLQSPSVAVVLAAPHSRAELEQDLTVLEQGPLSPEEYETLARHGERVRRHAGNFP
jgi:aryl-alcohol dehydrogenase-like predicted oxidoreductase